MSVTLRLALPNKSTSIYLSLLGVDTASNTVDLLVHLGTVMVALLTGTSDSELDARRMPSTDTSNLTQTLVSLAGQFACVPTGSHTC